MLSYCVCMCVCVCVCVCQRGRLGRVGDWGRVKQLVKEEEMRTVMYLIFYYNACRMKSLKFFKSCALAFVIIPTSNVVVQHTSITHPGKQATIPNI